MQVLFELPSERYLAFRYCSTEIIEDLAKFLGEVGPDGNYPIQEAQKFIQYATAGLKNNLTREFSARCLATLLR